MGVHVAVGIAFIALGYVQVVDGIQRLRGRRALSDSYALLRGLTSRSRGAQWVTRSSVGPVRMQVVVGSGFTVGGILLALGV